MNESVFTEREYTLIAAALVSQAKVPDITAIRIAFRPLAWDSSIRESIGSICSSAAMASRGGYLHQEYIVLLHKLESFMKEQDHA